MPKEIELSRGLKAIVDDADFANVSQFKWSATIKSGKFYAVRCVHLRTTTKYHYSGKMLYLHTYLAHPGQGFCVDHINGNTLDCRRENLRVCRNIENCRNRVKSKNNTSGYKGVTFTPKTSRWRAHIMVDRVNHHLGYFDTPAQAAYAYNVAALQYFGEFAKLNDLTFGGVQSRTLDEPTLKGL